MISEAVKRNYELEGVKYIMQGRKVRDHPLQGLGDEAAGASDANTGFGG
jgi:hypothetical protein